MLAKNAPIGIDNFADLTNKDDHYLFVDKSLFIKEIIEEKAKAILITRPRRWGKTLNMSMLQHFFAPEIFKVPTKGMFDNLQIAQIDGGCYMQHNRQHPVIFLSLKDIKESTFEAAVEHLHSLIRKAYRVHEPFLMNSTALSDTDKRLFTRYLEASLTEGELKDSMIVLSELLFKHYDGKKVYILVDEYDAPLNTAYDHGYVNEMVVFMKGFLSAALKGNDFLKKGVMTGILRVSKESMLSGLNNLEVFTILNHGYSSHFGFSEQEVKSLFSQCGLPHKIEEVRKYYNGYRFGDQMLYNPWSIINCLKRKGEMQPYWINTSDDHVLRKAMLNAPLTVKEQLQDFFLSPDKTIQSSISESARFEGLEFDEVAVWSLLLATGYLSAECQENRFSVDHFCELRIPNEEVRTVYLHIFRRWLQEELSEANYLTFMRDLSSGRVDKFTEKLEDFLLTYGTGHEFKDESNYHTFMLGLLAGLNEFYDLHSNTPTGFGRLDLMLVPKNQQQAAIILELKHSKTKGVDKKLAVKALEQIDRKRYDQYLKRYPDLKNVLKIGMAFGNRTAVSCYRWEDIAGKISGELIYHETSK